MKSVSSEPALSPDADEPASNKKPANGAEAPTPVSTPAPVGRDGRKLHGAALLAALGQHLRPTAGRSPATEPWGTFKKGRLAKVAARIQREITCEFENASGGPLSPLQRRAVQSAARAGALAEQAADEYGAASNGRPRKVQATRRTVMVAERYYRNALLDLERRAELRRKVVATPTLGEQMRGHAKPAPSLTHFTRSADRNDTRPH